MNIPPLQSKNSWKYKWEQFGVLACPAMPTACQGCCGTLHGNRVKKEKKVTEVPRWLLSTPSIVLKNTQQQIFSKKNKEMRMTKTWVVQKWKKKKLFSYFVASLPIHTGQCTELLTQRAWLCICSRQRRGALLTPHAAKTLSQQPEKCIWSICKTYLSRQKIYFSASKI